MVKQPFPRLIVVSEGISAIEKRSKGELRSWNCVQAFNAASFTVTVVNSSIATRLERKKERKKRSTFDGERSDRHELDSGEAEFGVMAACV